MFRGKTNSKLDPNLFGAGSFVMANKKIAYMVVSVGNGVRLLNMTTFEEMNPIIPVEDPNFLSEDECRKLISGTGWAFSDFDFDPRGFKTEQI